MLKRRFWSRPVVAASLLAMMLGGSACSAHPGTAVAVDGTRYTVDQVNSAVGELSKLEGQPVAPAVVAYVLAMDDSVSELASENGIDLTDSDIRDLAASQAKQAGVHLSDLSIRVLRISQQHNALAQKIGQDEAQKELQKKQASRHIDLNPRYGTISKGQFVPPTLTGVKDGRQPATGLN